MSEPLSDDALEAVLLDKDELISSLRRQLLFWAQEYSTARNELIKARRDNVLLQGMAHKAAEIVLHTTGRVPRGGRWPR